MLERVATALGGRVVVKIEATAWFKKRGDHGID